MFSSGKPVGTTRRQRHREIRRALGRFDAFASTRNADRNGGCTVPAAAPNSSSGSSPRVPHVCLTTNYYQSPKRPMAETNQEETVRFSKMVLRYLSNFRSSATQQQQHRIGVQRRPDSHATALASGTGRMSSTFILDRIDSLRQTIENGPCHPHFATGKSLSTVAEFHFTCKDEFHT